MQTLCRIWTGFTSRLGPTSIFGNQRKLVYPGVCVGINLRELVCWATKPVPAERIAALVQGKCETAPPAALLSAEEVAVWQPGQCLVVVDNYLLQVMYSSLWLDSLFVSLQRTSQTDLIFNDALITVGATNSTISDSDASSVLWLTRSVISGDTDAVGASRARNPVTAVTVQLGSSMALHGVF